MYRNIPIVINFKGCTRFLYICINIYVLILISDANNYILRINSFIEGSRLNDKRNNVDSQLISMQRRIKTIATNTFFVQGELGT